MSRAGRRFAPAGPSADLRTAVGSVHLPNPVLTASGTSGHGSELAAHFDLSALGAVVVKSVSADPWPGNDAPRVHETPAGMINSVGLQGEGVEAWLANDLPPLLATGARVIASIWGRSVGDYQRASELLNEAPAGVVAVEINLSCPNVEDRSHVFAHDANAASEVIAATSAFSRPRWAKLSPNVTDLPSIAAAVQSAGAAAVTLVNTVMGLVIDTESRRPLLGSGSRGGGLSGPAIHPVAVRAVFDVHAALPDLPIVGVGGVASGAQAIELLLAGASAVQVGTATFADPRAPIRVLEEVQAWCRQHGVDRLDQLIGGAHG